jgi:16S rRNA C967 or C1407 C5-methylase (RsmB/RsmF family)
MILDFIKDYPDKTIIVSCPKDIVVDFCAGAGGKTLAIAAAMNNRGRIFALDKYSERLENAKSRFRRAGIKYPTLYAMSRFQSFPQMPRISYA